MSSPLVYAIFAFAFIALSVFYLFFYRNWRRQRELQQPFPETWRKLLHETVPFYSSLPSSLKKRFEEHVQLFIAEKDFYGCDGFEVDDTVRVTIAGHACLLVLERPFSTYDEVRSILVYPDIYRVQSPQHDGMIVHMNEQVRAGEASSRGQGFLPGRNVKKLPQSQPVPTTSSSTNSPINWTIWTAPPMAPHL